MPRYLLSILPEDGRQSGNWQQVDCFHTLGLGLLSHLRVLRQPYSEAYRVGDQSTDMDATEHGTRPEVSLRAKEV